MYTTMNPTWNSARPIATAICVLALLAGASVAEAQPAGGGASALAAPTPASSVEGSGAASIHATGPAEALADPRATPAARADASDRVDGTRTSPDGEADRAVGPRVELGYSLYGLSDGESRGRVNAGSFGGYFHAGSLRLGAYAEVGKRADRPGVDDLVVRAVALAGYQYRLRSFVPYLAALGTYGWLIEQGTGAPRTVALPGGGLELGLDLRLGAVFIGASAAWTRIRLRGETQDLFLLRIRAGV